MPVYCGKGRLNNKRQPINLLGFFLFFSFFPWQGSLLVPRMSDMVSWIEWEENR